MVSRAPAQVARESAAKEEQLRAELAGLPSLIVALSGGTDSAYLAWIAKEILGRRALAVTALSASFPESEQRGVEEFVRQFDIAHEFLPTDELSNPLYVVNEPDRCYHCKDELFAKLDELARARSFAGVAYGVNVDDLGDFRPGQQAARDHRVLTPLLDAGLTKAEIRELSQRAGLPTWDKPAAACLASRIAHGIAVTEENLEQVERGEEALRELGFRQVRVRYHGDLVRVEIAPEELPRALTPEMAQKFAEIFKALGFKFVTLDLEGYRQGSFNPQR
ncbi:MAG: ATP-dependent sacrificial sulfur transferase LarE [Acidobacteria bacterium]|nr:ATP-dependent sacrificial sulfur transferase LarE [Acidobacteriota bacterium]